METDGPTWFDNEGNAFTASISQNDLEQKAPTVIVVQQQPAGASTWMFSVILWFLVFAVLISVFVT
ncbi:hypothetical protein CSC82_01390 [Rhodobacteraceae bacterium 4F10]|nr:hypothetical protein CSC82_01390 [Rhodobacteraceae bacterium 4F10]